MEKKIKDFIIDIKIYLFQQYLFFKYLLKKDTETFDSLVLKIINQLTNYYDGGRAYKINNIVDNFMILQELMIKDDDISISSIWELRIISKWLTKNMYLDDIDVADISYKVFQKAEKTFKVISDTMNYDNYLMEHEILEIIKQIKKEK